MANSRNASLDGLRGIAVLLVLLYHHGLLNSGWLGVDLFFVLSGYLITTILRRGRDSSTYWSAFWIKRILRILPALSLVLLLTLALSFALSAVQAAAYLLSFGDVLAYLRPHFEPLRPLWSLAVEEHFYLVWPFAVRYWSRRTLLGILIALIVSEPVLRAVATSFVYEWQLTYFLTPFRLDGLAFGALLALAMENASPTEYIRKWSAPAGFTAAAVWFALRMALGQEFTRGNPTVVYNALCYSLVAAMCTCVIAYLVSHQRSLPARFLAIKGLAWIGLVSYGLYLYQVPIHEATLRFNARLTLNGLLIDGPLTLVLAALSYYMVERPLMSLAHRRPFLRRREATDPVNSPAL